MRWIMKRSVRVLAMSISEDLAREARFAGHLAANGMFVEKLSFYGVTASSAWQKGALQVVCARCPNVTEITFDSCLTLDDCNTVINAWPRLQGIALPDCANDVRSRVASGLRHLTTVTVKRQQEGVPSESWKPFCETVTPNLQHFRTHTEISDEALLTLLVRSHELRSFETHRSDPNVALLNALARNCPLLEKLELSRASVTKAGLTSLAQGCKNLAKLSIFAPSSEVLESLPAVRSLSVVIDQSTSTVLCDVCRYCPLLEKLTVLTYDVDRVDCCAAVVALGKGCPRLRFLLLSRTPPTDALLVALGSYFPNLAALAVNSEVAHNAVTDAGVCALALGCPKLYALLWTVPEPVTMVGITALATHCPELRELTVVEKVAKSVPHGSSFRVKRVKVTVA
jgi:hypothetical protein